MDLKAGAHSLVVTYFQGGGETELKVQWRGPGIDKQEIPGITGGALDSHEELPGPIYLQGSEKGLVAYRSIIITPAKQ